MYKNISSLIQEILLIINLSEGLGLEQKEDLRRLIEEVLESL